MLTSFFLRLISKDVDSIVAFIGRFHDRLDAFLAKHDAEVAGFEQDIIDIKDEAAKSVAEIEDKIASKVRAAETVLGLKKALPAA